VSQYRRELIRGTIALILIGSSIGTGRYLIACLIVLGTVLMFAAMKWGGKYKTLGSAIIASEAVRLPVKKKIEDSKTGDVDFD